MSSKKKCYAFFLPEVSDYKYYYHSWELQMLLCINTDNYKLQYSNHIYYCSVFNDFNFILLNAIRQNGKYF